MTNKIKNPRNKHRLESFDPAGWTKHSEYHFSRTLNGLQLDYWPSTGKYQYNQIVYSEKNSPTVQEFIDSVEATHGQPDLDDLVVCSTNENPTALDHLRSVYEEMGDAATNQADRWIVTGFGLAIKALEDFHGNE